MVRNSVAEYLESSKFNRLTISEVDLRGVERNTWTEEGSRLR